MSGEPRPPLRTNSGDPFDAIDVANHLATWLAPRLLAPETADLIEEIVNRVVRRSSPLQQERLSTAAKHWLIDCPAPDAGVTSPTDTLGDA